MSPPVNAYAEPRRRLRRIRVRDAFRFDYNPENERKHRDVLLELLLEAVATDSDNSSDAIVDAAVSVALARVAESERDYLLAFALSVEVLASNHEFARLRLLASQLRSNADEWETHRPILASTLSALAFALEGKQTAAMRRVQAALGLENGAQVVALPRTRENVLDAHLANALRRWLESGDDSWLERSISLALDQEEPLLYQLAHLLRTYAHAYEEMALVQVLVRQHPEFRDEPLDRYLRRRGISTLFRAQRQAIEAGALHPGVKVVAMPTSSGKTLLAELRAALILAGSTESRVIYLAPYRLLARQVERELRRGLSPIRAEVRDLGGTFDSVSARSSLSEGLPDVAVMTPERLDAIVRLSSTDRSGSAEARELISSTSLIVFDEIHLLGRGGRGPRLELTLSRVRQLLDSDLIGLAALTAGIDELASWVGDDSPVQGGRRPTGSIELLWQPNGKLVQRFAGRTATVGSLERSKTALDDAARLVSTCQENLYPVLILCTTRPNAESVARKIHERSPRNGQRWIEHLSPDARSKIRETSEEVRATLGEDHELAHLLDNGLAYHHAGLPSSVLRGIEDLAQARAIRAMGATTTVAEGADLPFQVVVIPHLNFQGEEHRRLSQELYLNIVGRAGRAGVALEGIVVVLGSASRTLRNHVRQTLWARDRSASVRGRLVGAFRTGRAPDDIAVHRDVISQVLAWLGEPSSDVENQADKLARSTFSWTTASDSEQRLLASGVEGALDYLETIGMTEAASPYRLTVLGERARLAGLAPRSCIRLARTLQEPGNAARIDALAADMELSSDFARVLAQLLFESIESLECSLWFRRTSSSETERASILRQLEGGQREWPYGDDIFESDIAILGHWIAGADYPEMSEAAPVFKRGLFASGSPAKRASDSAEYMSRLAYPASWTWSGVTAVLGPQGELLPPWIGRAIEYGVPSAACVALMEETGISRRGALLATRTVDAVHAEEWQEILGMREQDLRAIGLTRRDRRMLLESVDR